MSGISEIVVRVLPRLRQGAMVAILAGALSACGSASNNELVLGGRALIGSVFGGGDDVQAQTAADLRAVLTPANIAEIGRPFLLVNLVDVNLAAIMAEVSREDGYVNWRDSGDNQITLTENGVLRATRGFGFDLMSTDVGQTAHQLVSGQSGSVQRTHVYVDGDFQSVPLTFTCQVTIGNRESMVIGARNQSVREAVEVCRSQGESFENSYWIDGAGQVQKSVQWIGPDLGHVEIERYVP